MKKTLRKKTLRKKTLRKKTLRKMRGGYREVNHATWSTVEFDETEKRNIKNYLKEHPGSLSTTIRENLFPNMSENLKQNANYEIQVVLGRQVGMR